MLKATPRVGGQVLEMQAVRRFQEVPCLLCLGLVYHEQQKSNATH